MTPERYKKIQLVLNRRQPDLSVLMENVNKTHNLAAIIRSCDATGVLDAHAVSLHHQISLRQNAASGSSKWVRLNMHSHIDTAITTLKSTGHQIVAVHVDPSAVDYRELDYTCPTALMVGEELEGLSDAAIKQADKCVSIPMIGMVQSLNVSVATALILYEVMAQRQTAGLYDKSRLSKQDYEELLFEWAYPRIAHVYRNSKKPYPRITEP